MAEITEKEKVKRFTRDLPLGKAITDNVELNARGTIKQHGNGNGGKRPGAGRKVGFKTPATRDREYQLSTRFDELGHKLLPFIGPNYVDLKPREIMLLAARLAAYEGRWDQAVVWAEKVAPYMHAKLSQIHVDANVTHDVRQMSDEELMRMLNITQIDGMDVKDMANGSE